MSEVSFTPAGFDAPVNLIALDVGEARIGVASGRLGSSLAFGRGVINRKQRNAKGKKRRVPLEQVLAEVISHMETENAQLVVIGLPRREDGSDSPQTQKVRDFAAALAEKGVEVVLEDERYTSTIASRRLATSSLPKYKRQEKGRVDEGAAVLILESYLRRQQAQSQTYEQDEL